MLTMTTLKLEGTVTDLFNRIRQAILFLWRTDKPLTFVGLLMVAVLVATLPGLVLDARVITGAPAWLKPAKFALSTAIYSLTLAWFFSYLPEWRKTRRIAGWTTAIVFVLEVAIIDIQAWRGTTSHFNVGTLLDGILFSVMGTAIVVQTLTSVAVAVALWRQKFADAALGTALRAGLTITLLGAATGGLMTQPTRAQLDEARATQRMITVGAHTVGAPDGGPGLPGSGWSVEHGDLRVPHFVGLHAIQALPLMVLVGLRRLAPAARAAMARRAALSYAGLFAILLLQALRGESVVDPGSLTIGLLGAWAVTTIVFSRIRSSAVRAPGSHAETLTMRAI